MMTLPIEKLPAALRREVEANPNNFSNADVMSGIQFVHSQTLQQEFRGSLNDYLAYCRGYAAGGARRIGVRQQ